MILCPSKVYLTFLGFVEAVDAIEKCGLACPVRANEGKNLAFLHLDAYPRKGADSAEAEKKVLDAQSDWCIGLPFYGHKLTPVR